MNTINQNGTKYVSKEKYEELKAELEDLKTVKRKEIADQLEYAKSLGDLSENAEYQEARDNQAALEERIAKIDTILKSAVIADEKKSDTIGIGSKVTIKEKKSGTQETWQIVGSEESDLKEGKISNESPIGAALIGRKEGDEVDIRSPGGTSTYKVMSVS